MHDSAPSPADLALTAREFAAARGLMVDGQLRPSKVTDRRILDAMRALPREKFLPTALASLAYIDDDVKLGAGRFLMEPLVLARLIQLARPVEGETALVVGAGTGYGAVVLSICGVHVTAVESEPALLEIARAAAEACGASVNFVQGRLAEGYAAGAPFDLVFIEGAVRRIPEALGAQVAATGRLVTVLAPAGGSSYAVLAEPTTGGLRARAEFDANTPLLPGLVPAPSFAF